MTKFRPFSICMVALAIVINIVGANIALWLHLPLYFDSIGTFGGRQPTGRKQRKGVERFG